MLCKNCQHINEIHTDIGCDFLYYDEIEDSRRCNCLKCGKILPTELKRNYVHNCEKPDFLL